MRNDIPADVPHDAGQLQLPSREDLPLEIYMGIVNIERKLDEKADGDSIPVDALLDAAERYCQANPDKARPTLDCLQNIIALTKGTASERTAARSQLILRRLAVSKSAPSSKDEAATTAQQVYFSYYLFHKCGVTWRTSSKAAWERLLSWLFGRGRQSVKEKLYIDFDAPETQKDLSILMGRLQELFPDVSALIDRDLKADEE